MTFVSRTLEYQYGRDYSWKKDDQVSVGILAGRLVLEFDGYHKHLEYLAQVAKTGAAKLSCQKSKGQHYLIVAPNIDLPDPQPRDHFVATDTNGRSLFEKGASVRHSKDRFVRARRSLQRQGTRSVTRRLVLPSGREKRFVADRNHVLSRRLLTRVPGSIFGLEDLTNIRDRTEADMRDQPRCSAQEEDCGGERNSV